MLAIDLVASALALLVLSPVLLVIAALIFFADGRPALFRQERASRASHVFRIYKFWTMPLWRGTDVQPYCPTRIGLPPWADGSAKRAWTSCRRF